MSFTFFATNADLLHIAKWVLDDPELMLFEGASQPDKPNRWFKTADEVGCLFTDGTPPIDIWVESAGAPPRARSVTFGKDVQQKLGGQGRTLLESPAVIRLMRNGDQMGCLSWSQLSNWTEKGARQRSTFPTELLDAVDWKAVRSASSRIQRTIRNVSPAKLHAYPIMPDAFSRMQSSEGLRLWWGGAVGYLCPSIAVAQV
ncbi:hypothetical protein [Brevundimonas sp.]|uniref:hypothetical protein n=1 Tax=Brevundimonas sp. TaxID=1871086 RepID=UPI002D4D12B2|nr:hypothetical protein [Brevundimonas sp.]HYC75881.1 hypothetical protein [Brevundimonas sp.]